MFKITLTTFFLWTTISVAKTNNTSLRNEVNKQCIQQAKRRTFQVNYKSKKLFRKLKTQCLQG